MIRGLRSATLLVAALLLGGAAKPVPDPVNPTCPRSPDWSAGRPMQFRVHEAAGRKVLLAEGAIDAGTPALLEAALETHKPVDEIWFRSPGGDAAAGNAAGRIIRKAGIPTRIPAGWACFSACNFMFMGGPIRVVEPGGLFIVHMFTHTGDRALIAEEVAKGHDNTVGLIGDIEQSSALLASDDNDFLIRMGVSRKLLTEVMYKQRAVADGGDAGDKSTRRCLTIDEVYRYNVANLR